MDNNLQKKLDIVSVFSETFDIFKKTFQSLILVYLLWFVVSSFLNMFLGVDPLNPQSSSILIYLLISFILTAFLSGTLAATVWSFLSGHENPLKEGVSRCLEVFSRLLGSMFLAAIFVVIGIVLFVVPGIIVALALSLVVPIVIIENPGITESLKRSYGLTDGNKVTILFMFLIVLVTMVIPMALVFIIGGETGLAIFSPLISGLGTLFNSVLYIVIYKRLSSD